MLPPQKTNWNYMLPHRGNFPLHVLCKHVHLFIQWIHSSSKALFILKERSRKIWVGWQPAPHLRVCQAVSATFRRELKCLCWDGLWSSKENIVFGCHSLVYEQWNHIFEDKMTSVCAKGQSWAGNGPLHSSRPKNPISALFGGFTWDHFKVRKEWKHMRSEYEQGAISGLFPGILVWEISKHQRQKSWVLSKCNALFFIIHRAWRNWIAAWLEGSCEGLVSGRISYLQGIKTSNSGGIR